MTTTPGGLLGLPANSRLTRRHLLTLWSAGCAVSLTGCGSGDDDVVGGSSGGASAPTGSTPPPTLATTTEAGPVAAADVYDRGVSTSAMVTAADGGTMALPDGATLIIPPGCVGRRHAYHGEHADRRPAVEPGADGRRCRSISSTSSHRPVPDSPNR